MVISLRILAALMSVAPLAAPMVSAQSPSAPPSPTPTRPAPPAPAVPAAPGAVPAEPTAPKAPAEAEPSPKPEVKKSKKAGKKSSKEKGESKESKKPSDFDPKSLLLKLIMNSDDDGDGALSLEEFRRLPLLKELKKDRLDEVFAQIDGNSNASLDDKEIGKGFGKITDLIKENREMLDDVDAAKQAKKLKRLTE